MGEKQKKQDIRSDLLLLAALIAWAFFVNRQFRISGLYKDDLYTWSCWGEQSFWQYAFRRARPAAALSTGRRPGWSCNSSATTSTGLSRSTFC